MARFILRKTPDVANEVLACGTSLNVAYQQARDIEAKSNSVEKRSDLSQIDDKLSPTETNKLSTDYLALMPISITRLTCCSKMMNG